MTWSSTLATGVVEGKSLRGTDCKVSGGQIVKSQGDRLQSLRGTDCKISGGQIEKVSGGQIVKSQGDRL